MTKHKNVLPFGQETSPVVAAPEVVEPMVEADFKRLKRLEMIVRDNMVAFKKCGLALTQIRDERLYRADFKTFQDYCEEKWGLGRSQADRLIGASTVIENLSAAGSLMLPANEAQARELTKLSPEEQLAVWTEVLANANGKEITAAAIRAVVERRFGEGVARATSSQSAEWYTPEEYADAAREVLGGIDLDPASCALANEVIQSKEFYTLDDNGLSKKWFGSVYLNPPYGKSEGGVSNQGKWSQVLIDCYENGLVSAAILLCNSQTGEEWFAELWDYPACFVKRRIAFWTQGKDGQRKSQPLKGNVFVYFGKDVQRFAEVFEQFGRIVIPENMKLSVVLNKRVVEVAESPDANAHLIEVPAGAA